MRRLVPLLSFVVAAAVAGGAAWLLLRGEPRPVVTADPVPRAKPPETAPPTEAPPEFAPPDPGSSDPPAEDAEPKEVPLPPDAYPWEVPGWWREIDRKLRDKEVDLDGEILSIKDQLLRLEREAGFPIRAGPELEPWAEDHRISLPARAPVRAVLEKLALMHNVELVLTADAVLLRQRGRAKEDRVTRAGRVQAAILESEERRSGLRPIDPAAEETAATPVDIVLGDVPLREAARLLGERISLPVYMDASLWAVNPVVKVEAGERPLSKVLDSITAPLGAAWDVTPRRVVLFKPGR